jgi:hypothetical protein
VLLLLQAMSHLEITAAAPAVLTANMHVSAAAAPQAAFLKSQQHCLLC